MTMDQMQRSLDEYQRDKDYLPDVIILSLEDFDWYQKEVKHFGEKILNFCDLGFDLTAPLFNGIPVQPQMRRRKFIGSNILEIK